MKLFLLVSLFVASVAATRTFHGDQVLRVSLNRLEDIEALEGLTEVFELDFWTSLHSKKGQVDIRVPAKHLASFKVTLARFRMSYEIFIQDVQALIDTERAGHSVTKDLNSFDYEVYHTFDEIQQWIDDMANEYPDLATASEVGTSFEGRNFKALTISTAAGRPQFVINCGIHAREWVTPASCMFSALWLVTGYQDNDATITSLMSNVDFVFIPSSNPDGYAYTWSNDRMWRKTRSTGNGICTGVDPNRNFDANHCGAGSSTSPCSDTYCGPSAFSEPCTLAQKNFVEGLPNAVMYVDVHSYSQMWMFPYGYTYNRPADFDTLDAIARDSVAAIKAKHGMDYEPGTISEVIYVASGSTADYFYDNVMTCTFATELRDTGRYGFVLPERLIKPTAEETFEAFKVMAQAIIDGNCQRK